jgi:hypothetical protein
MDRIKQIIIVNITAGRVNQRKLMTHDYNVTKQQ